MKGNKELAVKKFKQGYNCCQAVACAYCEELGVKEEDVFRLTEGFGLGMGGLRDTCGAVTGMFLVISLANSAGDMEHPLKTKMDTYARFREAARKFTEKNGSIYCRDLKNMDGPQPLICCTQCVEDAAELIDEMEFGQESYQNRKLTKGRQKHFKKIRPGSDAMAGADSGLILFLFVS